MALQLSMKPTGWFHIGWSGEIAPGAVKPMKYFGKDLVAFRSEDGELAVLDAHCHHLGAHLGYGGKVRGKSVVCPYHGWQWDTQGRNTLIPYQDNVIRKLLRKWTVAERFGLIFLWHDPAGGAPREGWELPNIFTDYPEMPAAREEDFYPCWPDALVDKPGERIHPQYVQENVCDTTHFRHTHGAPLDPELLWFRVEGTKFRSSMMAIVGVMGAISASKRPALTAAAARCIATSANASCISRVMPYFFATNSAVSIIGM